MRRAAGALVAALGLALALAAAAADELPGADAVFVGRGVAILWGVVRGPDEARTRVVIRIERLEPVAPWRLLSVEALDPFTRERAWVRLAVDLAADPVVVVAMSRESFLAKPSRRILFYREPAHVQANQPDFVVSYVSIPDTVPEFASAADLEEHFRRIRERLPR
jgi:hypothetical protein